MTKAIYRRKGLFWHMVSEGESIMTETAWQEVVGIAAGTGSLVLTSRTANMKQTEQVQMSWVFKL